MAQTYVDPDTVSVPVTGGVAPAALGTTYRNNFEALIQPPSCSVYSSSAQVVATGTNTILDANSEREDNDALHSTVTNISRVTINKPGIYLFVANVQFEANAGTRVIVDFFHNGATVVGGDVSDPIGAATDDRKSITRIWRMAASEYMEVRVNHNHGSNRNVTLHEFGAFFMAR